MGGGRGGEGGVGGIFSCGDEFARSDGIVDNLLRRIGGLSSEEARALLKQVGMREDLADALHSGARDATETVLFT